jgi:hypothetical protein
LREEFLAVPVRQKNYRTKNRVAFLSFFRLLSSIRITLSMCKFGFGVTIITLILLIALGAALVSGIAFGLAQVRRTFGALEPQTAILLCTACLTVLGALALHAWGTSGLGLGDSRTKMCASR